MGTVLFCLTDSADGAAGQTGRTVPNCLRRGSQTKKNRPQLFDYFRIVYIREAREMRMLVPESQRLVTEPTLEFCDFTLLGST